MAKLLRDILAALPAERRRKVEARAAELIAEEMTLRELRKALGRTQAKIAADLGVGQDTVSRYEQRSDMLLSTLRLYVSKMGGELVLTVRFPHRKPVQLTGFAEMAAQPASSRPQARRSSAGRRARTGSRIGA